MSQESKHASGLTLPITMTLVGLLVILAVTNPDEAQYERWLVTSVQASAYRSGGNPLLSRLTGGMARYATVTERQNFFLFSLFTTYGLDGPPLKVLGAAGFFFILPWDDILRVTARPPKLELLDVNVHATAQDLDFGYVVTCTLRNLGGPGSVTIEGVLRIGQEAYQKRLTAYMQYGETRSFRFVFQREVSFLRGLINKPYGSCRFTTN